MLLHGKGISSSSGLPIKSLNTDTIGVRSLTKDIIDNPVSGI